MQAGQLHMAAAGGSAAVMGAVARSLLVGPRDYRGLGFRVRGVFRCRGSEGSGVRVCCVC